MKLTNASVARSRRAAAGFTLLETMVAVTIFSVLGYSLAMAVDMGNRSQTTIARMSADNRSLRAGTTGLFEELRSSADATITITALADGNHRVRFMMPIDDGGAMAWGVFDRTLGSDAASQNKVDWSVQYTVRNLVDGNGNVTRQLVRQLLDEALVVQKEKVLASGLRSGADDPPGFTMIRSGDLWEVTLSTVGSTDDKAGTEAVFHVQTRN